MTNFDEYYIKSLNYHEKLAPKEGKEFFSFSTLILEVALEVVKNAFLNQYSHDLLEMSFQLL